MALSDTGTQPITAAIQLPIRIFAVRPRTSMRTHLPLSRRGLIGPVQAEAYDELNGVRPLGQTKGEQAALLLGHGRLPLPRFFHGF